VNEIMASTAVRGAFAESAAALAEASPAFIAGAAGGAVAAIGGAAVFAASRHSEVQAENLRRYIRQRGRRRLAESRQSDARRLFEAVQWNLQPQKAGLPHVYHGSVWRNQAREQHLIQIEALREVDRVFPEEMEPMEHLWSDMSFLFKVWLHFNPHTANWGTSESYGTPPMHFCWHNRWREDLRHVASDLARRMVFDDSLSSEKGTKEYKWALCLLGALDHILSWYVVTPSHGESDLVAAGWHLYHSFCSKLSDRFAFAWAAAQAPAEAELELEDARFDEHVELMARREIPEGFRSLW